ncbi:MAG TPA: TIGR04282 family arsenosugar biosynthesis glycosyltransferase [Candidatus Binataceae bacterium]|nr:TIGR04282 family arsenosugar biosynthesis glycosyltransferase [Candidatus Binataceae bacterium]
MRSSPTFIVFTRKPLPGATKTRLAAHIGAHNAAALADAFTRDALAKLRALGMPLIIAGIADAPVQTSQYFRSLARRFDANLIDQEQGNLGARMARVMAPFARRGVLLMGTDTPSIPVSVLKRSVSLLRQNQVVLGPSLDGGYYLVGIHGMVPDMFRGIRWGSSRVLEQTLTRLIKLGIRPALAPAWYDVDRWGDLILLAEHLHRLSRRQTLPCPATAKVLVELGLLGDLPLK